MNVKDKLQKAHSMSIAGRLFGKTTKLALMAAEMDGILICNDKKQADVLVKKLAVKARSFNEDFHGVKGPFILDHYTTENLFMEAIQEISKLESIKNPKRKPFEEQVVDLCGGNPGALNVLMGLHSKGCQTAINWLEDNNYQGAAIWVLFCDEHNRDADSMLEFIEKQLNPLISVPNDLEKQIKERDEKIEALENGWPTCHTCSKFIKEEDYSLSHDDVPFHKNGECDAWMKDGS